jgi:SAM-dependent methyltransferase
MKTPVVTTPNERSRGPGLTKLSRDHLEVIRRHYEHAPELNVFAKGYRKLLAHYYNLLIPKDASVLEIGCGTGELLSLLQTRAICGIDPAEGQINKARARLPYGRFFVQAGEDLSLTGKFDAIIISDTLNFSADVQLLLQRLHNVSTPKTRLFINFYSQLWRPALELASRLGLRSQQPPGNWISPSDVFGLLYLADWEPIKRQSRILYPALTPLLNQGFNRWLAPLLPPLCLSMFITARPKPRSAIRERTVSVVIPARNEAGNIEAAVERTPTMGAWTELIFVEGNSKDDTWAEILRIKAKHPHKRIKALQQSEKGKGNAVREGFAAAEGNILMILDADLTMPPEELPKFFAAVANGHCDFANGSRLVYPMERRAMRFLNMCANKAFSILFTWLLDQPVKDTLCGTKVLTRENYGKIIANRSYFGDFDPFCDFDLLFGAAKLNLKISDVPIRYQDRTYGQTNVHRWRHGMMLLKMVLVAARKLKFV